MNSESIEFEYIPPENHTAQWIAFNSLSHAKIQPKNHNQPILPLGKIIISSNSELEVGDRYWSRKNKCYGTISKIVQGKYIVGKYPIIIHEYTNDTMFGCLSSVLNEPEIADPNNSIVSKEVPKKEEIKEEIKKEEPKKEEAKKGEEKKDDGKTQSKKEEKKKGFKTHARLIKKEEKKKEKAKAPKEYDMLFNIFDEPEELENFVVEKAPSRDPVSTFSTLRSSELEQIPIQDAMISVPIKLIIAFIDSIQYFYIKINCNNKIDTINKYLKQKYGIRKVHYYSSALKKLENEDTIYYKLGPGSTILGIVLPTIRVYKRLGTGESTWPASSTKLDAIRFDAAKDLLLCGFSAYSPIIVNVKYQITFKIKLNGTMMYEAAEPIMYDGANKIVKYMLGKSNYIKVKAGQSIVIIQSVNCAYTFKGTKYTGKQEEMFTVRPATECNNGTSTSDGQIAELFYISL